MKHIAKLLAIAMALGMAPAGAFPTKPLRFIMPFPAGGAADIVGRLIADKLSADLGQQTVIDNRPGAGGSIAAEITARAAPDGHTFILGGLATHVVNPLMQGGKASYDPLRDFTPITLATKNPNVLCVHPGQPVKTVRDYIALAKAKQGQLIYASAGNGTSQHLSATLFEQMAGVRLSHVPYRGGPPAIADLVGGQVPSMFITLPAPVAHIQAGRLRAIAVTSDKRSPSLPDIPTIAESGLPGYSVSNWYGVWGPARLPAAVLARLNQSFVKALKQEDLVRRIDAGGAESVPGTPAEFDGFIRSEYQRWKPVIAAAGLKAQ
jgi:tripartite-type tricarboxylate transporter receptor subunit TctC